ncbi:MAG: thiamine diphosphokinase [Actinomycetota bacterium]
MTRRALVIAGGPAPHDVQPASLPPADLVVAADGGADHARLLGLVPDVVVGDLDSLSVDGLDWIRSHDIEIIRHPVDKDATDLDLAMTHAAGLADEVLVIDSGQGRLDHSQANILLLASERFASVAVIAATQHGLITVVRGVRKLQGHEGDVVSLLAVGGPAGGVTTSGLRWPLADAVLEPGSTLGVSNEFVQPAASVSVDLGVVLAVQPVRRALD